MLASMLSMREKLEPKWIRMVFLNKLLCIPPTSAEHNSPTASQRIQLVYNIMFHCSSMPAEK